MITTVQSNETTSTKNKAPNMRTISIDIGNKNIKTDNFVFTTGCSKNTSELAIGSNDKSIYYNGYYYSLSDDRIPYTYDKTTDERFYILVLFGIAQELEKAIEDGRNYYESEVQYINLITSLPPMHMDALKEKLKIWLKKDGMPQTFKYGQHIFTIIINDAYIAMQGHAALMAYHSEIIAQIKKTRKRTAVGIDIGGFTVDTLPVDANLINFKKEQIESFENGIITLYNAIQREINSRFNMIYSESDIDACLTGEVKDDEAIASLIDRLAAQYIERLEKLFRERGIDLQRTFLIFIGGGASVLEDYIKAGNLFGKCELLFIKDVQANVKGARKEYAFYTKFLKSEES